MQDAVAATAYWHRSDLSQQFLTGCGYEARPIHAFTSCFQPSIPELRLFQPAIFHRQ